MANLTKRRIALSFLRLDSGLKSTDASGEAVSMFGHRHRSRPNAGAKRGRARSPARSGFLRSVVVREIRSGTKPSRDEARNRLDLAYEHAEGVAKDGGEQLGRSLRLCGAGDAILRIVAAEPWSRARGACETCPRALRTSATERRCGASKSEANLCAVRQEGKSHLRRRRVGTRRGAGGI